MESISNTRSYKTLVQLDDDGTPSFLAVPIHHGNLDNLIGRLMQMCDLIGDVSQRKALKDTIKQITRDWLDDEYTEAGYDKYDGIKPGIKPVSIPLRTK